MNKIIGYIIVLFFCLHTGIKASPFSWADSIGGTGTGVGRSEAVDIDNNIYVCGELTGTFQPGNIKTNGKTGFLIKYSSEGSVIWSVPLPGLVCRSINLDVYQFPCIAGYFSDTVHIGKYTFVSAGKHDFFVIKFDSLGHIIWATEGGGPGNDEVYSVASNIDGNTFVTGSFENYFNFNQNNSILSRGATDFFVAEYDSTGNFIWATNGGGIGDDAGTAISVDLDGNIFVTGYFNGLATFHNNTLQSNGGKDIFILKYSSLGQQLAVRDAGGPGEDRANAMSLDGSGNVYLAGTFSGTANFGGKTLTSTADDGFVAAYDNGLNINWIHKVGGPGNDAALGIKADWQSNIFLTGAFAGTADFYGKTLHSEGLADIFIVKYDAAGRFLWAERAGGPGADSAFSVGNDYDDIASITGVIYGPSDFGDYKLDADTGGSFFISKLQLNPADININNEKSVRFTIYPNPTQGEFMVDNNDPVSRPVAYSINNISGKNMISGDFEPGQTCLVNINTFPDGIYFIRIETDRAIYMKKIIKTGL